MPAGVRRAVHAVTRRAWRRRGTRAAVATRPLGDRSVAGPLTRPPTRPVVGGAVVVASRRRVAVSRGQMAVAGGTSAVVVSPGGTVAVARAVVAPRGVSRAVVRRRAIAESVVLGSGRVR